MYKNPSSQKQQLGFILISSVLSILGVMPAACAQTEPPQNLPILPVRPLDPTAPLEKPPAEPPKPLSPILPGAPTTTAPAPLPSTTIPEQTPPPSDPSFYIEQIKVIGSTVLQQEITDLLQPLENREVTFKQILDLRSDITQLYIENGYITSGAFIPNNQDLSDGVVEIQVLEGELEDIQIIGLKRLRKNYVRDRVALGAKSPLNRNALEKSLQLLQLNPLLDRVNAELTPGSATGRSILVLDLEQSRSFHAGVTFDNHRSPAIGSLQGGLEISHDNVLGIGDRFFGKYAISEGLNTYDLSYTFPINARDGTIGIRYSNADSEIIEEGFRELGINSNFDSLSFDIRQPVIKSPNTELAIGLSFGLAQSQSFRDNDVPFPLSFGADDDGQTKVRALRLSQEWTSQRPKTVFALRSQFNIGLDIFDATVNEIGPSADFFSWLGQAQFVKQLPFRSLLISRLNVQVTPDSLLSLEKFGIGGIDSVRGYTRNQILTDNGILGSLEFRFPLTSDPRTLQLSPFVDIGHGWNNFEMDPESSTLMGIGLGMRWQPRSDLTLRLDYGVPLFDVESQGNSLQDSGIYFSIRYQPL